MQSRETFGYLTTEQALADFAENIVWLKRKWKTGNSPVVLFGGSYGGMLATWFRMKYPHLAIGAVAGSAPIWQFPGIYDCHQFYQIVTKDFADYSPACAETIRLSWKHMRDKLATSDGRKWISQKFNLCTEEDLESPSFQDRFVAWITSAYESLSMTDYPNPAVFLQPMPAYPIRVRFDAHFCDAQLV